MITIVFLGTSLISLFFSFIFATELIQRKEWFSSYISISLFFFSLASLSLFIGHLFAWYSWTIILFNIAYALIFPHLLGIGLHYFLQNSLLRARLQLSLAFASLLFILVLSLATQLMAGPDGDLGTNTIFAAISQLKESSLLYKWLPGFSAVIFTLVSLWLWQRRESLSWLWFALSGLVFLGLDQLLLREGLGLASLSLLWIILLGLIWRALSIDFSLDLSKNG